MRDVTIYSHPVAEPGHCGKCLSQNKDWFVDLGFNTVFNREDDGIGTPIWTDGAVYLCCDCFNGVITDVERNFGHFLKDVLETHRGYVTPVGVDVPDDYMKSKFPVRLRDDFPEELHMVSDEDLKVLMNLNETQREEVNTWYYAVLNPEPEPDPAYADYIPPVEVIEDDGTNGTDEQIGGTESSVDGDSDSESEEPGEDSGDSESPDESSVGLGEFSFGSS